MPQPAAPEVAGLDEAILRGLYRFAPAAEAADDAPRAQLLASGTAIHWALDAQRLLAEDWGVAADVWSATSWNELRRDALAVDEHNRRHPDQPRSPYVTTQLEDEPGPVVAVSDWMRAVPDQIAPWVPNDWASLGTDGFGRSDTRPALRRYFGVDAESVTLATIIELVRRGELKPETVGQAQERYGLGEPVTA